MSAKLKKGDFVIIMKGRDAGKEGKVLLVDNHHSSVIVEGLGLWTKHHKPSKDSQGGIQQISKGISISNVQVLEPKLKKRTKIFFNIVNGKKLRYSRLTGESL